MGELSRIVNLMRLKSLTPYLERVPGWNFKLAELVRPPLACNYLYKHLSTYVDDTVNLNNNRRSNWARYAAAGKHKTERREDCDREKNRTSSTAVVATGAGILYCEGLID